MDRTRYFDHAATTPIDPRVLEAMLPFLTEDFGNASSIHSYGAKAMVAVEQARQSVAELIGAEDPAQIVFTSGATEAANWVIGAFASGAFSPFEHSAVREPALRKGFHVLVNEGTSLHPSDRPVELVAAMSVNNEIGARWNARDLRGNARYAMSDLTQQVGKLSVDLEGLDFAVMSAHKLYGPKGVGALYFASEPPTPFQIGGEQEHGYRAGTLNVPGIVGFGTAARIAADEMSENEAKARKLRGIALEALSNLSDWRTNGGDDVSPYILSASFYGIEGETLVVEADGEGFAISAGAACSSRSTEPSHVLSALGVEEAWLRGTVRISFGATNTEDSTHALARTLLRIVEKLRTI